MSGLDIVLNLHHQGLTQYIESEPESYVRFISQHYSITHHPSLFQRQEYRVCQDLCSEAQPHLPPPPLSLSFPSWWIFLLAHTHAEVSPTLCSSLALGLSLPLKKNSLRLVLQLPSHFTPKQ